MVKLVTERVKERQYGPLFTQLGAGSPKQLFSVATPSMLRPGRHAANRSYRQCTITGLHLKRHDLQLRNQLTMDK
jgi:hypothetical protein